MQAATGPWGRRAVLGGLIAIGLQACSGGGTARKAPATKGMEPPPQPVPNAGWDAWVAGFRPRATARGISGATLNAAFVQAGFLPTVIEKDRNQTEFTRTLEDYLVIAASEERVSTGIVKLREYHSTFAAIEARYGVEQQVVAAVWGLESMYGSRRGNIPVVSSLSTLAYEGRRAAFFEDQLVAALRILQNGDVTPARMTGSWAGAMGHTQFIPTSYLAYAVDFAGDGRRDIWGDDPTDALASTAAYFERSGWRHGQPWGVEVALPAGFNPGLLGRGRTKNPPEWAGLGVRDMDGRAVPDHGPASILAPMGLQGPAFMVFPNFSVIGRYNNAESYMIGIGHLSDRLVGGGPIRGAFPPDANGLMIAERQEIQARLTARGFDTGGTDGVIGAKTKGAISAWQAQAGLPATGEPSPALLTALRAA